MCTRMCAVIFPADRELMGKVRKWRKAPNHLGKVASECTAFTPCKTKGQYIPTPSHWTSEPRRTQNTSPAQPRRSAGRPERSDTHEPTRTRGRAKHRMPVRTNQTDQPHTDRPETNKRAQGALTHMRGLYRNQQQANEEGPALRTNSNPQNDRNIRIRTKSQHDQHEKRQCARKRSQNSTGCRTKVLTESQ